MECKKFKDHTGCRECNLNCNTAIASESPGAACSAPLLCDVKVDRATPVKMRAALQVVGEFKKAGIMFVAMPVLNNADGDRLASEAIERFDLLDQKVCLLCGFTRTE